MTPSRRAVLEVIADDIDRRRGRDVVRVGIDGVDGAGKTMFADELADALRHRDVTVIRASVDGFHNPREVRYRQGRDSPEGYVEDSFDYGRLREVLLDPLGPGGSGRYVRAVHDVVRDEALEVVEEVAVDGSVLVFDGIFLHRPELVDCWDCSVFLKVDPMTALDRMARRDGTDPDPDRHRRYLEGQQIYLDRCQPWRVATFVVDNNDLDAPRIV